MKVAPALYTHGRVEGVEDVGLYKVLEPDEARRGRWPRSDVLVMGDYVEGCAGTFLSDRSPALAGGIHVSSLRDDNVVRPGDIVRLRPNASIVSVVYRRGSKANVLFVTERCNSRCLMCSQPPRDDDDSWRLAELHRLVALADPEEEQLAVTGGEPTLLGEDLALLLEGARARLPTTHLHVLTNGRLFENPALAARLVEAGGSETTWAVPLYGDVASVHDEIVDASGAFQETLQGLYELATLAARVEIRIVLHALSIPRLPQLASFIYRRLPFAEHVTFMGLEPMGHAKNNRERLWIDPADYLGALREAVHHLAVRGMNASIYNLPHCVLPKDLWPFARASISDWKNRDAPECKTCSMRAVCSGFFASAGPLWRSRLVSPFTDSPPKGEVEHELA